MLGEYDRDLMVSMATLFRGRPFTKSVPFQVVLPAAGAADQFTPIWVPQNSFFELAILIIRSDVAGVDLAVCDSNAANPFLFVMPPTTIYQRIDINPGYRSLSYSNASMGLNDPTLSGATMKGVALGWEVDNNGYYR